jgi:hypothetical protein
MGIVLAEIIDRIRSLYKKSPSQRELVEVNGIIEEILMLLKCEADRYSVAMRTELAADLPKIMADRVQLQQVFMNLMLNGIQAMADSGGELTVKSQLQDGQLQFSVSDTGVVFPTRRWIRSFLRSLRPSRRAAAWDYLSAVRLWSHTAGCCGQPPTMDEVQPFISACRSHLISGKRLRLERDSAPKLVIDCGLLGSRADVKTRSDAEHPEWRANDADGALFLGPDARLCVALQGEVRQTRRHPNLLHGIRVRLVVGTPCHSGPS